MGGGIGHVSMDNSVMHREEPYNPSISLTPTDFVQIMS